jgi:acetyl-CoA carboxylase beta subunit
MSLTKGITVDIATPDFGLRDGPNTIGMKATPCSKCHLPRIPLNQDFKLCPDCRNKVRLSAEAYRKRKLSDKRGRVTLNQGNSTPQNRTDTQPSAKLLKRPLEGKDSEKAAKRRRKSIAEGGVHAKDRVKVNILRHS